MIHVFIGTKAQYIKMAPIMLEMGRRGIAYNFVDAGQHSEITGGLIQEFGLHHPNVSLRPKRTNVDTLWKAATWTFRSVIEILLYRKRVYKQIFQGKPGVCLIHGDRLLSLYLPNRGPLHQYVSVSLNHRSDYLYAGSSLRADCPFANGTAVVFSPSENRWGG